MKDDDSQSGSRRWAAIDVGSNTVRLLVADIGRDRRLRVVTDTSRMTRLGRGLSQAGGLDPAALEATIEAAREFSALADAQAATRLLCLATAAVRERGDDRCIAALQAACGAELTVLSGDEEARLTYLGAIAMVSCSAGRTAVVDLGGGSTEIAWGDDAEHPQHHCSVAFGVRRATERFLDTDPPAQSELAALRREVTMVFSPAIVSALAASDRIVGVGGTVTTLGELAFGTADAASGRALRAADIAAQADAFCGRTLAEVRAALPGDPDRAEVIVAGAIILYELLRMANKGEIIVSYGGIRHGVLLAAGGEQ